MIVIKDIEYYEVNSDVGIVAHFDGINSTPHIEYSSCEMPSVTQEAVYGNLFYKKDGTKIKLGNSKAVQDFIGIQFEAWEKMNNENSKLIKENNKLKEEIERIRNDLKKSVWSIPTKPNSAKEEKKKIITRR